MPERPTVDLTGRVVLVTGGTRGVGRGIAEGFLAAGARVVVCGRNAPEQPVGDAEYVALDVRDADLVRTAIDAVFSREGRLDVVVNNAGGAPPSDAATVSPRFVSSVVTLNLLAPFYVAQAANAVMQQQSDGGVILNIGSVSGSRPSPGTAAYGAAKAGLRSLTQSLAVEWAPKVRVNLVSAGPVHTELSELHYGGEDAVAAVGETVPLGRMALPSDVAGACVLLASPLAAYISGAELLVHGGGERPAFLSAAEPVSQSSDDMRAG